MKSKTVLSLLAKAAGPFGLLQDSPITLPMGRRSLAIVFADIGFTVGAEVGVWKGEYAETLCSVNPGLRLLCVDPWSVQPDYLEQKNHAEAMERAFERAQRRLGAYQVVFMRETSLAAAARVSDGSLDFVYIDGNHRYESVVQDIAAWSAKVRSGGIVAGHDFTTNLNKHIRVEEAVRDYVGLKCIDPWFVLAANPEDINPSWLWVKQ